MLIRRSSISLRSSGSGRRAERRFRGFAVGAFAALAALLCGWAQAPQEEGPSRIVIVHSKKADPFETADDAFRKAWKSGSKIESVVLEEGSEAKFAATAGDGTFAYVALGTEAAARLARSLATGTPLAFCMVSDPEGAGVTQREGTAGVRLDVSVTDQLALVRDALPNARRIGVLSRTKSAKGAKAVEQLRAAIPSGWSVVAVEVAEGAAVADAIATLLSSEIDLVWTYADSSLFDGATVKTLLLETIRRRVPVFGYSTAFVRAGALLGVGVELEDQGTQAAEALRALVTAGSEKQTTIAQPRFTFAINRIVAEKLNIPLSDSVVRAAKVVFDGD